MTETCLCRSGQVLRQNWIEELEQHASPDYIFRAMRVYFRHKNTCPNCCSQIVLDHNRLYHPELFQQESDGGRVA